MSTKARSTKRNNATSTKRNTKATSTKEEY